MKEIGQLLDRVIEENRVLVDNWLAEKPGSWGALSGKAIVAITRHLGRSLNDEEKHAVWQMLWDKLMGERNNFNSSS